MHLNIYEDIRRRIGLSPKEVCVVGNNFKIDVLPALKNGYEGILISEKYSNKCPTYRSVHEVFK